VLDDHARPIDAIPGLYHPDSFIECLHDSLSMGSRPSRRTLVRHHARRSNPFPRPATGRPTGSPPSALDAGPLAFSKARIEMPAVRALVPPTDEEGAFNATVLRPTIHRMFASGAVRNPRRPSFSVVCARGWPPVSSRGCASPLSSDGVGARGRASLT